MGAGKALQALLVVAAALAVAWGVQEHRARTTAQAAWDLATQGQIQVSKSTAAKLASTTLERDSLAALVHAAKQLGGTLVAGATVTVTKHDTTAVHDTLPTTVQDSVRTARFRDSTFAGVVSGVVTAPKCCAPLGLELRIERPAFRPQVGVVNVAGHLAVVVDWQGEQVTLDNVYAAPVPPTPKRVVPWAEATYAVVGSPTVRAGVALRLFGFTLGPSVAVGNGPQVGLTLRKEF